MRRALGLSLLLCAWGAAPAPARAADAAQAESQYRIARRLAAERSPEAAAALRRVVELDPHGALADDALVEASLLLPLPRWPEELGILDAGDAQTARGLLERAITDVPSGDRIAEARFLRALLALEPLPGHDARAAREDLIAASTAGDEAQAAPARYALAWLHEREGRFDRAFDGYDRIVVDWPAAAAAARARVGLARIELRRERPGAAARWLQPAIDADVDAAVRPVLLRELAVRRTLPPQAAAAGSGSSKVLTGLRSVSHLAPLPDGVLLASARDERVVRLDAGGSQRDEWSVRGLECLAVDADGRPYVAADEGVWRLLPGGGRRHVATTEGYAPVEALAVGGLGELWLLDRRGQRIGHVAAGQQQPGAFWEDRELRLLDLAWDGAGLVALDSRSRTVIAIGRDGRTRVVSLGVLNRPSALAADPSGAIAVLDPRQGTVHLGPSRSIVLEALGVSKPAAFGLGFDGALHVFDEADGGWFRER